MKHYNNYNKVLSAITLALMMLTGTSMAQVLNAPTGPNKVYIEQIGNTNTVTIVSVVLPMHNLAIPTMLLSMVIAIQFLWFKRVITT